MTDKRLQNLMRSHMRWVFAVMLVMCAAGAFIHGWIVAACELAAVLVLWIYFQRTVSERRRELVRYIDSLSLKIDSASGMAVADFPLPLTAVDTQTGEIVWGNSLFIDMLDDFSRIKAVKLSDNFKELDLQGIQSLAGGGKIDIAYHGADYRVYGGGAHAEGFEHMCSVVFVNVSEEKKLQNELNMSRPVLMLAQVDNYDDLVKNISSYDRTMIMASIEARINAWAESSNAIILRGDRDRYTIVFEERYLEHYSGNRFSVLDAVRNISNPGGMAATLSIGVGREGKTLADNYQNARLALDMALSRGGDQAVIKSRKSYEFFGGSTREVEKRTKVRSRVMANAIQELITNSSQVIAMGHKFSDMDALGAACGVACICRKLGVTAHIVYDPRTTSATVLHDKLADLPEYSQTFVSGDRAVEMFDPNTLLVVVDTNRPDMVDAPRLLKAAERVVVIDHHRRAADYIQSTVMSLHEPYASSTCELMSEVLQYIVTSSDILRQEAECMLSGVMLDTKNFTMKTGVRTFEAAAFFRKAGADTIEVKRMFQDDMEGYFQRCDIIKTAEKYRGDIAIAFSEPEVSRPIAAQAADELLNIEGIQASFVVFRHLDSTNISGRSLGKVNVQVILERLGGGGSMLEAGAQPGDKSVKDVIAELKTAINEYYSTI